MLPLRVKDFTQAGASQNQEADGRDGVGVELDSAVLGLWCMLRRWFQFIHVVGQSNAFALTEHVAKTRQLFAGQEPFAGMFLVSLDPACRINAPFRQKPTAGPPCKAFRYDGKEAVRGER